MQTTRDIETSLQQSEEQIPNLAVIAVRKAYQRSLAAGQKILIADSGVLYEVSKDGGRQVVKRLPPHVRVTSGRILKLS